MTRTTNMLAIDGELTIYRAAELCANLKAAMGEGGDLELDLAAVTEIDCAGIQLLMAAKKTAQAAGGELHLVGHSPAVLEVFEILDLASHFGDPVVMPPVSP